MPRKNFMQKKSNISNPSLYDRIRKRLKLTSKQLPDSDIKKVIKLNGRLIGDWVVNNADGFKIKDNGIIIVSKWMPKCLRGDKEQKIEEILNNPKNDEYMKKIFIARYNKAITTYKSFTDKHFNLLHSFFYIYRIIWFNSRNCKFDKADLYELIPNRDIKMKLAQKIIEGKDFYEYLFSDFRERKRDKLTPEKLAIREKRKAQREAKKLAELEKLKEQENNE